MWTQAPPPCEQGSQAIQLPYFNKFETIWEYEKLFLSDQIDFISFLGVHCPICKRIDCYRPMAPYWRNAIELFPEFKKKRIPIARFLCRRRRKTFSLLPVQLIPYFQYTVGAVVGTRNSLVPILSANYRDISLNCYTVQIERLPYQQ